MWPRRGTVLKHIRHPLGLCRAELILQDEDLRRRNRLVRAALLLAGGVAMAGCGRKTELTLFELLPPSTTGVTFMNAVPEQDTALNIINFLNYYNGGGVAVGDVDGDGLPDLYFTSNLGPNRLYRNKGNYQFEDITERAGVADPEGWKTGVTMADVNGDGRLDIYVSAMSYLTLHGHNVLYINNGDGTFTDRTKEYGLDFAGYSTQAVFFDYDGDGDLDMYLLNYSAHSERGRSTHPQREPRHPRAGDRLFRNDGGHFVDVSDQAHIYGGVEGYGLGVVASDLNGDGCPDLYVANDFQEDDFLYINNCDGTFTESIATAAGHSSHASMGVDAADVNGDGRQDLFVANVDQEMFSLYRNNGNESFADIAHKQNIAQATRLLSGWGLKFFDYDNDGNLDLLLANGNPDDLIESLHPGVTYREPPLLLRNTGRGFQNVSQQSGPIFSTPLSARGMAIGDVDNDGRVDILIAINDGLPLLLHNQAGKQNHWLGVNLVGKKSNPDAIGARVAYQSGDLKRSRMKVGGGSYLSSHDPRMVLGIGVRPKIDWLEVKWPQPSGLVERFTNLPIDRYITIVEGQGKWK